MTWEKVILSFCMSTSHVGLILSLFFLFSFFVLCILWWYGHKMCQAEKPATIHSWEAEKVAVIFHIIAWKSIKTVAVDQLMDYFQLYSMLQLALVQFSQKSLNWNSLTNMHVQTSEKCTIEIMSCTSCWLHCILLYFQGDVNISESVFDPQQTHSTEAVKNNSCHFCLVWKWIYCKVRLQTYHYLYLK